MGFNDNRRSNKMRRRARQKRLKERIARRRVRLREEREAATTTAPVKKRAAKEPKAVKEPKASAPTDPAADPAAPSGE
jgi:hypothetical protein